MSARVPVRAALRGLHERLGTPAAGPDQPCRSLSQIVRRGGALSPGRRVTMNKQRWVTYGLLSGVLVLTAWAASAMPRPNRALLPNQDAVDEKQQKSPPLVQIPKAPPRVEVVFALDTTGSMSGLIDGAKRKIWSLAQFIANGQPRP